MLLQQWQYGHCSDAIDTTIVLWCSRGTVVPTSMAGSVDNERARHYWFLKLPGQLAPPLGHSPPPPNHPPPNSPPSLDTIEFQCFIWYSFFFFFETFNPCFERRTELLEKNVTFLAFSKCNVVNTWKTSRSSKTHKSTVKGNNEALKSRIEKVGTREEPRIRGRWTVFEGRLPRQSEKAQKTKKTIIITSLSLLLQRWQDSNYNNDIVTTIVLWCSRCTVVPTSMAGSVDTERARRSRFLKLPGQLAPPLGPSPPSP